MNILKCEDIHNRFIAISGWFCNEIIYFFVVVIKIFNRFFGPKKHDFELDKKKQTNSLLNFYFIPFFLLRSLCFFFSSSSSFKCIFHYSNENECNSKRNFCFSRFNKQKKLSVFLPLYLSFFWCDLSSSSNQSCYQSCRILSSSLFFGTFLMDPWYINNHHRNEKKTTKTTKNSNVDDNDGWTLFIS